MLARKQLNVFPLGGGGLSNEGPSVTSCALVPGLGSGARR